MKLLAISDAYIPPGPMKAGLSGLARRGVEVEVRHWAHPTVVELQRDNLAIEQGGPDAVPLPREVLEGLDAFDLALAQFAPLGAAFLAAASRLKVIGVLRTGTENVDVAGATRRGISVLNTPARNARAVAECAIGLILAETRNLARAHAHLKRGEWRRRFPNSDAIPELGGKTVGLVGYGAVAQIVARCLAPWGCRLLAFDPFFTGDPAPAELVDLPRLLAESDVVSLHARYSKETHHLIGAGELARMKPGAVLVNTARSGLVDEEALVRALQERRIMGAALDVFDREPLPPDHPLLALDNATLVPHLAGSTIDAFHGSPKLMAGHLERMLAGGSPLPIVNGIRPSLGP
jgi:D-3-phosphoglycerate dehydrogenase